eukprot:c18260_g1_i1.p1 GENE.c18260_g1_i1~~c18260_g1_i1.p1  ORF type:complete len:283 (+),score=59.38 c18260_g1_i1:39-851(+)
MTEAFVSSAQSLANNVLSSLSSIDFMSITTTTTSNLSLIALLVVIIVAVNFLTNILRLVKLVVIGAPVVLGVAYIVQNKDFFLEGIGSVFWSCLFGLLICVLVWVLVVGTKDWKVQLNEENFTRQCIWSAAAVLCAAYAWTSFLWLSNDSTNTDIFTLVTSSILASICLCLDPEVLNADDSHYHGEHIGVKHRLFVSLVSLVPLWRLIFSETSTSLSLPNDNQGVVNSTRHDLVIAACMSIAIVLAAIGASPLVLVGFGGSDSDNKCSPY